MFRIVIEGKTPKWAKFYVGKGIGSKDALKLVALKRPYPEVVIEEAKRVGSAVLTLGVILEYRRK